MVFVVLTICHISDEIPCEKKSLYVFPVNSYISVLEKVKEKSEESVSCSVVFGIIFAFYKINNNLKAGEENWFYAIEI